MSRDDLRDMFDNAEGEWADTDRTVALFQNVVLCARAGVAPPQWVVQALAERVHPWLNLEVGSLDDAFGVNRYSNDALKTMKHRHRIRKAFLARKQEYLDRGETIPWEDLAQELGTSVSNLQKMK
jgi:hypothetical protein